MALLALGGMKLRDRGEAAKEECGAEWKIGCGVEMQSG